VGVKFRNQLEFELVTQLRARRCFFRELTRPCHDVVLSPHECIRGELPLQALWQLDQLERRDSWYYLLLPIVANHRVLEGNRLLAVRKHSNTSHSLTQHFIHISDHSRCIIVFDIYHEQPDVNYIILAM
jgi:hypothetical protein